MSLKRVLSFYITFLCVLFIVHSSHSCTKETHQHEDDENEKRVTTFSVSNSCQSFFSQSDYTYSFPFVDEDDLKILKSLEKVFGNNTYSNTTWGTYSIAIDYDPSPQSDSIYRQTRYLVSSDKLTQNSIKQDGYQIFSSSSEYAPRFYKGGGRGYHMENALMTSLEEDKDVLLEDIFNEIPKKSTILGVCIKLYSSYDCCSDCRLNILKHVTNFQEMFYKKICDEEKFVVNKKIRPFMVHGLMVRYYGKWSKRFTNDKCEKFETNYNNLFNQIDYHSFSGKIDGNISQTMMPVYIQKQPCTEINSKKSKFLF